MLTRLFSKEFYHFGLLLFGLLLFVAPAYSQPLRVAMDENHPPFSYFDKDNNRWLGFEVDLINEFCLHLKTECQLIASKEDERMQGLLSHAYDMVMAIQEVTPDLKSQVITTSHYYSQGVKFVRAKDKKGKISYKTLDTKMIGVKANSASHKFLAKKFTKVTIKTYDTHSLAYKALLASEVDLVLADRFIHHDWLNSQPDYHMVGPSYTNNRYFNRVAIALRKTDAQLFEKINKIIKQMRKNGRYKTIRKRYFPFAIYGR